MGSPRSSGAGTGESGRAVVAAGLMVGVCVGVGGCSGDGVASADARGAGDPVAVVRRAADSLMSAGSSQARTSMEMATGGTRVTIRGEGVYDFRRRSA